MTRHRRRAVRIPAVLAAFGLLVNVAAAEDLGDGSYWLVEDSNRREDMPNLIRMRSNDEGAFGDSWEADYSEDTACANGAKLPSYATIYGSSLATIHRCSSIDFLDKCRWQMPEEKPTEEKHIPESQEQDAIKEILRALRESRSRLGGLANGNEPPPRQSQTNVDTPAPPGDTAPDRDNSGSSDSDQQISDTYRADAKIRIGNRAGAKTIFGVYKTERWVPAAENHGYCKRQPEQDREYEFALTRTSCPRVLELTQPDAGEAQSIRNRLDELSANQMAGPILTAHAEHSGICAPPAVIRTVIGFESAKSLDTCFELCRETEAWLVGIGDETGQVLPAGFQHSCKTQCGLIAN